MTAAWYTQQGVPQIELPNGEMIHKPHREWVWHNLRWRWLLDSWVGGETYRMAVYGFDLRGFPVRNLIRHKREYPAPNDQTYSLATGRPPGTDPYNQASDDDYELRRARTPVPTKLADVIDEHLSKIFKKEIKRDGPDQITAWWENVDGRGMSIDQWMIDEVAPLLLLFGQIDFLVDHPAAPDGEKVLTKADQLRLNLDSAVACYVLPHNIPWWRVDRFGQYQEVLIREAKDDGDVLWRYWDKSGWQCYDSQGGKIGDYTPHPFGRVPVQRVFDKRRPDFVHVGMPRYEGIAELMREFYNRDSELILSDTTQAHPLLQGPEDYIQPDGTIPIGPNWLLPKKKTVSSSQPFYEGFEVIQFPKEGANSIRTNKHDILDAIDRSAHLTKPAGVAGSGSRVTGQSGFSKRIDQTTGNDMLSKVATMLERAEQSLVELAWCVLTNGQPKDSSVKATKVSYPREFDLFTSEELLQSIAEFEGCLAGSGGAPETETRLLQKAIRLMLPGLDDEIYTQMDDEIAATVQSKANLGAESRESGQIGGQLVPSASAAAEDPRVQAYNADVEAFNKAQMPPADTFMAHNMMNQGAGPN